MSKTNVAAQRDRGSKELHMAAMIGRSFDQLNADIEALEGELRFVNDQNARIAEQLRAEQQARAEAERRCDDAEQREFKAVEDNNLLREQLASAMATYQDTIDILTTRKGNMFVAVTDRTVKEVRKADVVRLHETQEPQQTTPDLLEAFATLEAGFAEFKRPQPQQEAEDDDTPIPAFLAEPRERQ
jgi:hypothetical protein